MKIGTLLEYIIAVRFHANPDDVIDSVGHYYLELFDDTKTTEVILIPESMKKRISPDELDEYEEKELEYIMINPLNDWSQYFYTFKLIRFLSNKLRKQRNQYLLLSKGLVCTFFQ